MCSSKVVPLFFETAALTEPGDHPFCQTGWLGIHLSMCLPHYTGVTVVCPKALLFYVDAGDGNLDPSAHIASTSFTGPSPQVYCCMCWQVQQGSEPFVLMFLPFGQLMSEGSKSQGTCRPRL